MGVRFCYRLQGADFVKLIVLVLNKGVKEIGFSLINFLFLATYFIYRLFFFPVKDC